MREELAKKVEQAVKLIRLAGMDGEVVEVAYSGGKDSDVILQLTKEAGINYRAIYKCTTIDPPKTLKHVKDAGAEILMPKENFFDLLARNGYPNRFKRFCCGYLKEYKVLDKVIMGVRKAESTRRAKQYSEPTECRFYGSKKHHVEAFYPILDWTDDDVVEFILDRGLKIHPLYYREDGTIDPKRRVGCMCCPLASKLKRIEQFKQYLNMVKAYVKAARRFFESHPEGKTTLYHDGDPYRYFVRDVFFTSSYDWELHCKSLFNDKPDYKAFLEGYFGIGFKEDKQ